jgi:hypothetical protein
MADNNGRFERKHSLPETDQRFGRLTVISDAGQRGHKHMFNCLCDCGRMNVVADHHLRDGLARSCGCYRAQRSRQIRLTHGRTETREYRSWCAAKNRCENPRNRSYRSYGGRGIRMSGRWRNSFATFLADMGIAPAGHTLDRYPDKNGNYEKDNCRWATPAQQANNTRKNVFYDFHGEQLSVGEIAGRTGVNPNTLKQRLCRGQNAKEAVDGITKNRRAVELGLEQLRLTI